MQKFREKMGKPHVFFVADQVSEQVLRTNWSMAINDVIDQLGAQK